MAKQMKIDLYCQRGNCCALIYESTFQRCIDYVDIAKWGTI